VSCGIQENKQTKANDLANILNIHVTKSQPEPVVQIDMNINVTKLQPEPAVQIENSREHSSKFASRECARVSFLSRQNLLRVCTGILELGFSCKKESIEEDARVCTSRYELLADS